MVKVVPGGCCGHAMVVSEEEKNNKEVSSLSWFRTKVAGREAKLTMMILQAAIANGAAMAQILPSDQETQRREHQPVPSQTA
jgi:hypothetical protein